MSGGLLQLLESLFRRRFWIVILASITLVSYLTALGINGLIAGKLARFTVAAPTASSNGPAEESDESGGGANEISSLLTRPQDESSAPAIEEEPEGEDEGEDEEELEDELAIREGDCQQSSVAAILVGTMVDDSGRWSYGIVQDQSSNRTSIVHVGMGLAGAEVLAIERERLWVLNDGREECLKPNAEPAPETARAEEPSPQRGDENRSPRAEPSARTAPVAQQTSGQYRSADDLRSGINRVSPTEYEIDRSAIQQAMDNPRMLQSQAPEFQQNFDNGRPNGIRLTRIPSGSIFSAIGIRQGDVIMEVNGNRITTAQRAMDLYDALQTDSRVEVVVQRRGRQRTLTYNIR